MSNRSLKETLIRYIEAGFPILYINAFEEAKVDQIIKSVAHGRTILEWSLTNGYSEYDIKEGIYTIPPKKCELESIFEVKLSSDSELDRTLFVIKDAHVVLENPVIIAALKELALKISRELECSIILVSPVIKVPVELEKYITILEMDYQKFEEIKNIIIKFINEYSLPSINTNLIDEMAMAFKGLSEFEINNILALAYADDGDLTRKDLQLILEQKQQMIKKCNIMEMVPLRENIDDIGGLENLKNWLRKKAQVMKNINKAVGFGVDMPKGVLIAGVPGCGKSLNAKVAASLFEVPLLRLDMGRLMGKYVGESEANMRKAISIAEAISPCVLWIDELEKAFAGIGNTSGNGEVTTRLFGNLLTWLQEKESPVFVVATANDIINLPTELMRKGRFDEIFYVGLPNDSERKRIFEIHIGKRRKGDLNKIDINELVLKTKGYSGADIEGVVKESIESVFVENRSELTTQDILNAIKNTHSLFEIMEKNIEEMSKEYENRKFKNASI